MREIAEFDIAGPSILSNCTLKERLLVDLDLLSL